jgi:outer membrane protein OmpA-like peptidoglycan-associated protein
MLIAFTLSEAAAQLSRPKSHVITQNLASKQSPKKDKKKSDKTVKVVSDRDGDGVPDSEDLCPDIPGPASAKGCPDSDNDGIPDFEDDCPNLPGLVEYKGCPDSDGDGIPDNKDACPYEKGPASNNGCPVVSSDQNDSTHHIDSIDNNLVPIYDVIDEAMLNDYERLIYEQERKKKQPATIEVAGKDSSHLTDGGIRTDRSRNEHSTAPNAGNTAKIADTISSKLLIGKNIKITSEYSDQISRLIKRIKFEYGKAKLTPEGSNALNELSGILKLRSEWNVVFYCVSHDADNYYRNHNLSINRGSAIKGYLTSKRISSNRIEYKSYDVNQTVDSTLISNHIHLEIK